VSLHAGRYWLLRRYGDGHNIDRVLTRLRPLRPGGLNSDGIPTVRGGRVWRVSWVQTAYGFRFRPHPKAATLPELQRRNGPSAEHPGLKKH